MGSGRSSTCRSAISASFLALRSARSRSISSLPRQRALSQPWEAPRSAWTRPSARGERERTCAGADLGGRGRMLTAVRRRLSGGRRAGGPLAGRGQRIVHASESLRDESTRRGSRRETQKARQLRRRLRKRPRAGSRARSKCAAESRCETSVDKVRSSAQSKAGRLGTRRGASIADSVDDGR